MILFKNNNHNLDELIKEGIRQSVCNLCANLCADEDGHSCDLLNPIMLTVEYKPKGDNSCTGCKSDNLLDSICSNCARMYDDFDNLIDYYEENS